MKLHNFDSHSKPSQNQPRFFLNISRSKPFLNKTVVYLD